MKTFDAISFPTGFVSEPVWESFQVEPGIEVRYPHLEPADWSLLLKTLRDAGRALRERPVADVVGSIGRAAGRLLDLEDPIRLAALEWLVPTAGISAEMAAVVLTGMARDWTGDRLAELLEREFTIPEVLDDFQLLDSGRAVHATGPDLSFHVGAGTVPGVSVSSLIRALLVKSAVFLKPGEGGRGTLCACSLGLWRKRTPSWPVPWPWRTGREGTAQRRSWCWQPPRWSWPTATASRWWR